MMTSDITQTFLSQSHEHGLRSLNRFTTFFEQSLFPMKIYSLDGSPVIINEAWEKLFESKPLNMIETPLIEAIQKAGSGKAIEVPSFWYNGKWLEASLSPVKDDDGVVYEIAIILKDVTLKIESHNALIKSITEKKSSEDKFKLLSSRFTMAAKAGNIGIWEWMPDSNYFYLDKTSEEILGFSPTQLEATSEGLSQLFFGDDKDHFWATVSQSLQLQKSFRIDLRMNRKDGSLCWVQMTGMPLYDDDNRPYHMVGTIIDITSRVEAEADHKFLAQMSDLLSGSLNQKEILKNISDHSINYFCDGVLVDQLSLEGEIKRLMVVHKNPTLVKQFMAMDEKFPNRYDDNPVMDTIFTGKPLFIENADIFWQKNKAHLDENYIQEIDKLGIKSSIRARLKGRESILGMITFFVLKDSKKSLNRRHIWLSEEIAYRASMAVENALIHEASLQAIRSRDEFLCVASHELKTPLQSLTLQNQMRKRNLDKQLFSVFTPDKLTHMIDADLRHLMRINRLIDDMLDISRIRQGKLTFIKERVGFCAFVKDVIERFRPQLEAQGCYLSASFTDEIMVDIDIYRIEQVIVNLLTNAMKYGAGKPIKVEVVKKNAKLFLMVHDKGPGIKEQDFERIFERFERAISSSEVSGLGLGLYISRQIMHQNKGFLSVKSDLGVGSTFTMELNCAP